MATSVYEAESVSLLRILHYNPSLGLYTRKSHLHHPLQPQPCPPPEGSGPLNLNHLLTKFSDHWSQCTIGNLNDYDIKLAKLLGEFVWHSHPDPDEMFPVLSGTLNIQLQDRDVILKPGEVFVVPKGVEHCPKADEEVAVMLLEPKGVVNTGDSERGNLTLALRAMEEN